MSEFNPTTRTISPADKPDRLTEAVLNSLTRPLYYPLSWGLARTFLETFLSAGVATVLMPTIWLRGMISQHAQQLWHLAEWLRLENGDPDAARMQELSKRIRFNPWLATFPWICAVVAVAALVVRWNRVPFDLRSLIGAIYGFSNSIEQIVFTIAISLAAFSNWLHLRLHARNVKQCLGKQIEAPTLGFGLSPLWILGGLILASTGAFWALPVMLAAAAHRGYTISSSARMRGMLAEQMRETLKQRRPIVRVPEPILPVRSCIRPNCFAPLPSMADFCPRCGTRMAKTVKVVA